MSCNIQEQRERLASQSSVLSDGGEDMYATLNENAKAVSAPVWCRKEICAVWMILNGFVCRKKASTGALVPLRMRSIVRCHRTSTRSSPVVLSTVGRPLGRVSLVVCTEESGSPPWAVWRWL